PINPSLAKSIWFNFQLDILRCAWAILLPACLWGASFPLALAAAGPAEQEPGRWVGRVYASNTLGAIIGAVASSLWLIPQFGTKQTQRFIMALQGLGGLLSILLASRLPAKAESQDTSADSNAIYPQRSFGSITLSGAIAFVVLGWIFLLVSDVPPVPWDLI